MKRYFSIGVLIALAALALGSCTKNIEEEVAVEEQSLSHSVSFNVSMSDQTRTGLAFKFVPNWIKTDEKNNVHLFETNQGETIEGEDVKMEIEEGRHNEVAHFSAEFSNMTIIVNPPSTGVLTRAGDDGFYYTGIVAQKLDNKFIVPAVQYPDEETLIDPNADFLVGDGRKNYSVSQSEKAVDLYFLRPVAASRLAIMNVEEGSVIKTVKITSTAKLTGSASYDAINFSTGAVSFDANSGETTITLDYGAGVSIPDDATFYAYFISLTGAKPITSIEVTTDTHVYTKTVSKTLTFKTDDFKNIAVDMSKVTPSPVNPDQPKDQNITFHKNNGTITVDSFVLGSGTYALPELEGVADGATVSWSLSESNPVGVASLDHVGTTWTLTPLKAGTVRVSVSATAVPGWNATSKSFVLTVTDAETQILTFTPPSLTVTLGEDFTEPALTGNKTAVTYSIDPEGVATIDTATGELTLVAAGNATVTATAAAGTGTDGKWYAGNTATYALTVNAAAAPKTYTLVAKQEDVVAGNYLIVSAADAFVFDGSGTYQGGYATIADAENISLDGTNITISGNTDAYEFAFAKSGNGFAITGAQGMIVAAAHNGAGTSEETYITFAETGGSVFLQRGSLDNTPEALLFSTTRGTSSEEYLYYHTTNKIFKIGGSGKSNGIHLYFAGERAAQTIAFSKTEDSYDMASETAYVAPTLTGANTAVSYSSSNTSVATVDADGVVTIVGKGETTITATAAASTEYLSATASFMLTVSSSNAPTYYKADEIEAGKSYLIVSNGYALRNDNGTVAAVEAGSGVSFQFDSNATDLWTATADGSAIALINNEQYLRRSTSGSSWSQTTTLSIGTASSTAANHQWTYDAEHNYVMSGTYYLYYSTGNEKFSVSTTQSESHVAALYSTTPPLPAWAISFNVQTATYDKYSSAWTTTQPALTTEAASVTYESSDETVATVSSTGAITALKAGTTTITATAAADATHKKAEASYTLTVVNNDPNLPRYTKVTSTSDLTVGAKYLVVYEGTQTSEQNNVPKVFDPVLNSAGTQFAKATTSALTVAIASSTITSDEFGDCQFTLESGYYLKADKANKYIYPGASGSSSVLLAESTATNALTITFDNGIAEIKNGTRYIVWSTSSHYFSCNTDVSGQYSTGICLYKLEGSGGTTPEPPTPVAQTLSFSPASFSGVAGTTVSADDVPTLSGAMTDVAYSSSDTDVVEVNASTGALTLKEQGTATITATAEAGTVGGVTYAEGTATYAVTVNPADPTPSGKTYTLIEGDANLVTGTYVIADKTNKYLLNASNPNSGGYSTIGTTTGVTLTGSTITLASDIAEAHEFVLTRTDDNLTVKKVGGDHAGQYLFASASVSNSYMGFQGTAATFVINKQTSTNLIYFSTTKSSSSPTEYLYKKAADSYFKLGQSGAPGGSDAGVLLYKLNDGGTTPDDPEPPTPSTQYYTKINSRDDLPGTSQTSATGDYLFVYENGTKAYVFKAICDGTPTGAGNQSNGHVELTKTGSAIEVDLTENGIAATDAVKACKIQLAHHATATRNDWTIKPASLGTYWVRVYNNGTNVRLLAMTSSGYSATFTFEGTGNNLEIKRTDSSRDAYWTYNATNTCFEGTSTASKISIYKLSE